MQTKTQERLCVTGVGAFHVVQDKQYKLSLQRADGQTVRLYAVTVTPPSTDPEGDTLHHVIAESEASAKSQALLVAGYESYGENGDQATAEVQQIPLTLQGWSKNQF